MILKSRLYGYVTAGSGGASGGGSSAGAANEIQKGDGSGGFSGSGLFSASAGNFTLGSNSTSGTQRSIAVAGSGSNVGLTVTTKGTGDLALQPGGGLEVLVNSSNPSGSEDFQVGTILSSTDTVFPIFSLLRESTGTPAVGIGVSMTFRVETSGGNIETGATIEAVTTSVTGGAEEFDLVFKTMVGGAAPSEHLRMGSNKIGFFGVAPAARQVVPTGSSTDDVITALQNLGLFSQT